MRKPAFCICKNKGEEQLHGHCAAVAVQLILCWTWSETPRTRFLMAWPICQVHTLEAVLYRFLQIMNIPLDKSNPRPILAFSGIPAPIRQCSMIAGP